MARLSLDNYHAPVACEKCGGPVIFMGVGEYKCDRCSHVMYDDYGIVRNYVETHRGATVVEISAVTGIPQSQIQQMLKDERLEITESSRVFMKCEGCGKEIRTGRFCLTCEKLAAAANAKKRAEAEREAHKKNISGYGSEPPNKGEDGAIRFRREH